MFDLPILKVDPVISREQLSIKLDSLQQNIRALGSVVIGFSGGVDSTLLLKVSREVLGRDHVRAVIGISETYPERELLEAMKLADLIDAKYETTRTEETDELKFQENPPDRCYYCKNELFQKLEVIRSRLGFHAILDGTNADDLHEFRPGMRALSEQHVFSPLALAGLTKPEIRILSLQMGLPTFDKPSFACLSSRFPYGTGIDKVKLKVIDSAENLLHDLGFRVVRVRYHDERTARVEVGESELQKAVTPEIREQIIRGLKDLGFIYVTLDLAGFRSGSMNEVLSEEQKSSFL